MKQVETWKTVTFVGSLLVLALIFNMAQKMGQEEEPPRQAGQRYYHQSQVQPETTSQPKPEQPKGPTPEEIREAERQKFLSRYLTSRISRQEGKKLVALAVLSEEGKLSDSMAATVGRRLSSGNVEILPTLFNPEFALDGLFAQAFGGSRAILEKLELTRNLDVLVMARQTVEYSANPSLENVLTANIQLELVAIPLAARGDTKSHTLRAVGAGFKRGDARAQAHERLLKQIENDNRIPNLVLP